MSATQIRLATADGLGVTTKFDADGDGVVDRVLTDVTTVNADGARQRVETNKTAALHTTKPVTITHRRPRRSDKLPMAGRTASVVTV